MNIKFPLLLLIVTCFAGVVSISYRLLATTKSSDKEPLIVEYCRSFFPVLLIVLLIRSFLVQPYHVPTGSLEPSVMPGDVLVANQFQYGLRLPVWRNKILSTSSPKRGQIVLFHDPVNPKNILIKRVIGLPGDHVSYIDKVLTINNQKIAQKLIGNSVDVEEGGVKLPVKKYEENLMGIKHGILINPARPDVNFYNLTVPKNEYLMMGDNRDDSDDGRFWGFLPEKYIIGRGMMVLVSFNHQAKHWYQFIRWNRMGDLL